MPTNIPKKKIGKIKALFEAGESYVSIQRRLKVDWRTIKKLAEEFEWERGVTEVAVIEEAAQKTTQHLINEKVTDATTITQEYLLKRHQLENLSTLALSLFGKNRGDLLGVPESKIRKVFGILRCTKMAADILDTNYKGARRALNMDRIDDPQNQILPIGIQLDAEALREIEEAQQESESPRQYTIEELKKEARSFDASISGEGG